jgi:hypothetical protein
VRLVELGSFILNVESFSCRDVLKRYSAVGLQSSIESDFLGAHLVDDTPVYIFVIELALKVD